MVHAPQPQRLSPACCGGYLPFSLPPSLRVARSVVRLLPMVDERLGWQICGLEFLTPPLEQRLQTTPWLSELPHLNWLVWAWMMRSQVKNTVIPVLLPRKGAENTSNLTRLRCTILFISFFHNRVGYWPVMTCIGCWTGKFDCLDSVDILHELGRSEASFIKACHN